VNNRILHSREEWEKIENEERKAQDMVAAVRRKIITRTAPAPIIGKKRSHEGVAAPPRELIQEDTGSKPSDPASHKQVLEHLKAVLALVGRGWSMPIGEEGTAFLDALELTDQIREKARGQAKECCSRNLELFQAGLLPKVVQSGSSREIRWRFSRP
jgi:hypothetical protein